MSQNKLSKIRSAGPIFDFCFLPTFPTPAPRAFPEFPAGRVPANKHTTPLATAGDTPGTHSQVSASPLSGFSDPFAPQGYGSLSHDKQSCVATVTTPTPTNSCPQRQPVSGLSFPPPRPPSLTKSPPPMVVETFPHSADLEDSGRVERKRREIGQVRPPQICSR